MPLVPGTRLQLGRFDPDTDVPARQDKIVLSMADRRGLSRCHGSLECRDGRWFMLALLNYLREWPLLAGCIGHPEWVDDPRFPTPEARKENATILLKSLEDIFVTADWPEWRERFTEAGITFGPIAQPDDHLHCQQVAANNMLPEIDGAGGLRTIDSPIRLANEEKVAPRRAPSIGEHTRGILSGIGVAEADIDKMIASGAAAG